MQELDEDWFKLGQCWQMQWNSVLVLAFALPADAGFQVSKKQPPWVNASHLIPPRI
jgi:hypothetical protein